MGIGIVALDPGARQIAVEKGRYGLADLRRLMLLFAKYLHIYLFCIYLYQ